ncbi:putative ABC transporter ATP-binding protein YxlF [Planctomycetes bacterium Poly30]|uniref:Putative ABC transporter ATP-binding protein YxlF n=1 Tax=Saltatorellus ferox TaxID=2528018 RepID=A0A518EXW3_9BACT|nr:putative ABC transporter ATP-binding protein YxlF [Planctomycetes bacterium Poly30]
MESLAVQASRVGRSFRTGFWMAKKTVALDDVTFDLAPGRTLGLVGPNGSGKSTLLRLLAGVDRPSTGSIHLFGSSTPEETSIKRRLAFLPDGQPFPAELRAIDALHLIASLKGMPRSERRTRVPAMLERVGLGDRARTRLGAFSRGMHRRFGLGQAFLTEPDLILLDEPTAGLDAPGFDVLNGVLQEARGRGATVILASHVASDLVEHCSQLMLLAGGRVLRRGSPDELLGDGQTLELRVRGSSPEAFASLEESLTRAATSAGASVVTARMARRSLLDLYAETAKDEAHR